VPTRKETYGATETIIGHWLQKNAGMRQKIVLATKVAGPSRGMPWVREGEGLTAQDILNSCDRSLKRLQTEVIDLYQIHWPERNVPMFGSVYYDPTKERSQTSIFTQLEAFDKLVKQGKVRYIGLSNETPWGVHEFVRLAEQHNLPRVQTVQNVYNLASRAIDNGLDETMHRLDVSSIPYSPLAFGLLTGKYDESGIDGPNTPRDARIGKFESVRKQRWGRPDALAAARRYNALARANGMTPTKMALAWCYTNWRVASTIIGVTTQAQLDEDLDAWGTKLSPEVLAEIDKIRWEIRDPAM
jgi:aryl-alcohol dehydrogenase-like predicted oxidoreductase